MKVCLLLQRQFAYIGHYLAVILKEKYGRPDFCGYVYLRHSYEFLKSQKDLNYTAILLDEDIHKNYKKEKLDLEYLRWLEEEYGLPYLWPYLAVDRVIMSNQLVREYPYDKPPYTHEEMLKILQVKAKAIINFLEKERPDYIFFSVIGAMGAFLLYRIAQKKGIKTIIVQPSSIKDRYILTDKYEYYTEVEKILQTGTVNQVALIEAQKFLNDFRARPLPYYEIFDPKKQPVHRGQQLSFLKPGNFFRILLFISQYIYSFFTTTDRHDYSYIGPWNYLKDGLKRKIRNLRGLADLYDEFNPNEDFAFFPLQYEPEVSLLLQAPLFTDQKHTIAQIAKSLPVGCKLYVKEHPLMVAYRPRSFYKELKKNPNVKLLNPAISSFEIIPQARLIFTITGTAGWEATLLKKPVITFGDTFYNRLSFVKNCRCLDKLPELTKKQLNSFQYNEKELVNFIAAIWETSAELNLQYLWEIEQNLEKKKKGLEPLADLLAKKLGLAQKEAI